MSSPRRTRASNQGSDNSVSTPSRRGTSSQGSRTPSQHDTASEEVNASTLSRRRTPARGSRTPQRTDTQSELSGASRPVRTPTRSQRNLGGTSASELNGTPRSGSGDLRTSSAPTPQRWGAQNRSNRQNMVVGASESSSQDRPRSPSSRIHLNPTSPLGAGLSDIDVSSPLNYGTPSSMSSVRTPRSGIRGTPIRMRPDIHADRRIRQVNIEPETPEHLAEVDAGPQLVIWGTDVVVNQCKDKFKRFVLRFIDPEAEEDERMDGMDVNQPLYLQKLEEIHTLEEPFMNVNCSHLEGFDADLYRQLVSYPQEVIPTLDMAINEMFFDRYPAAVLDHQIQVRPFNAKKTKNMRALNPEDIDQLITISGMVTRTSNIIPEMREAFFKCVVCAYTWSVEMDRGRIAEPTICTNCNTNYCFQLVHNRSQFVDKQHVKLQESPDAIDWCLPISEFDGNGQETTRFHCPICNRSYKRKGHLASHLKYECGKKPQFQCPQCLYCSKRNSHLKRHILLVHLGK